MTDMNRRPKWDEEAEVIVIGSGFAGLAAATEARSAGSSVIILEKMKGYGGNSVISDGGIAAAGTPMQAKAGLQDSAKLMYEDMIRAGRGLNQPGLVRTVAESSSEVLQWTKDCLGVEYKDRVDQFGGHSVPRSYTTHNRSGSAIVKQLLARITTLGMRVRTKAYLQRILRDADDRICGVVVREGYSYPDVNSGFRKYIKVRKSIVLATGGFANDIDFRTAQDPRLTARVDSTNKYSTTAEALKEALRIGAMPVHLSWIQLGPWTSPDEKMYGVGPDFASYIAFPYGIMVNPATGGRVVNELADRKTRADAILAVGRPCIGIADSKGVEQSGYRIDRCLRKGVVKSFERIEEIADYYSIQLHPLEETIERYNTDLENSRDKEFGKPYLAGAEALKHPPYHCIRLWPKVHHTMGGILINEKAQVLDLSKRPIKGLYAAGEVAGGVHGACRLGSCAITDCLVFGRIAGRNAALDSD